MVIPMMQTTSVAKNGIGGRGVRALGGTLLAVAALMLALPAVAAEPGDSDIVSARRRPGSSSKVRKVSNSSKSRKISKRKTTKRSKKARKRRAKRRGGAYFTGGLGLHYPAELIGCLTIPAGAGNTGRQIEIMKTFGTTTLHTLPSYGLRLARSCREAGVVPGRDLNLRFAFVGAEPHSAQTRARLEEALDLKAYNVYGLSEMCGPGVAIECPAQEGLHLREDHYLAEIVDPDSGEPLPDGEDGELVLTTLNRQATPLLRYRTRDITHIIAQPCPCGSQHRRIAAIIGRTDDMLIVRGTNVYPVQIERILMAIPEIGSNYLIALETVDEMDEMTVSVEISADYSYDDSRELQALRDRIRLELQAELLFRPRVELGEPGSLPTTEGKAVRVVDRRGS